MLKVFKFPELRRKIFITVFIVLIFRVLAHVPIPGVDIDALKTTLAQNPFLGLFDIFTGGGLQRFSIVTMGLGPYISASIIVQLFTMVIPELERLSKEEGDAGREKINMYSRFLTIPIAVAQAYAMYFYLSKQGVFGSLGVADLGLLILTQVAGTVLLMWIGELVTEYGIGNGISLLIFVGIISRLPVGAVQFMSTAQGGNILNLALILVLVIAVIAGVVMINEGTRNVPLEYGRTLVKSRKVTNYLPIKINQAGVIPIIFAMSVVMVPSLVAAPLQVSSVAVLQNVGRFLSVSFASRGLWYNVFYFLLVFGFTYFYTSLQFNPEKISDDIKKRGGFIPGIRPGRSTTRYLSNIVTKVTFSGGVFLGLIAILPFILEKTVGITAVTIGGTGLLIVVSVILETIRQIQSQTTARDYQSFLE